MVTPEQREELLEQLAAEGYELVLQSQVEGMIEALTTTRAEADETRADMVNLLTVSAPLFGMFVNTGPTGKEPNMVQKLNLLTKVFAKKEALTQTTAALEYCYGKYTTIAPQPATPGALPAPQTQLAISATPPAK